MTRVLSLYFPQAFGQQSQVITTLRGDLGSSLAHRRDDGPVTSLHRSSSRYSIAGVAIKGTINPRDG